MAYLFKCIREKKPGPRQPHKEHRPGPGRRIPTERANCLNRCGGVGLEFEMNQNQNIHPRSSYKEAPIAGASPSQPGPTDGRAGVKAFTFLTTCSREQVVRLPQVIVLLHRSR